MNFRFRFLYNLRCDVDFVIYHVFVYFFYGLECVGHSFAYVAHFICLKDVCIRTQRAAVASRRATNLATYLLSFSILQDRFCFCHLELSFCHLVYYRISLVIRIVSCLHWA
jgi:hypothetical protein